jgi:hypothetical protein
LYRTLLPAPTMVIERRGAAQINLKNFLEALSYLIAPTKRNGNKSIPLIILKTSSSVNPTILNGSKISHRSGSKKINARANGQHRTNRIHHKISASNVFIQSIFVWLVQNRNQFLKSHLIIHSITFDIEIFINEHEAARKCTLDQLKADRLYDS